MGTNVKINIFGTYPVTSANVNRKNYSQLFFKHDGIYIYYYLVLFSKIRTVGGCSFFSENCTIFITIHLLKSDLVFVCFSVQIFHGSCKNIFFKPSKYNN